MTPSLLNFLLSIVSGVVVVGLIFGAVLVISQLDKVRRRNG